MLATDELQPRVAELGVDDDTYDVFTSDGLPSNGNAGHALDSPPHPQTSQSCKRQMNPDVDNSVEVCVTNPTRVGDGMSAHIVYQVQYNNGSENFSVDRRFSDFLGLHAKLVEKYLECGIIIPPAPEKDLIGSTKVRMSKNGSVEMEFVERRRLALERFLRRLLCHPKLKLDEYLHQFLQLHDELPRATNTQLLSGASAKKMLKNFGDVFGKIGQKLEDPDETHGDEFFDAKVDELESWERQLKRVHASLVALTSTTQAMASTKFDVSRCVSAMANVEEHTGMAQALSRLAETDEYVSELYASEAEAEHVSLVDMINETLGMIQACKDVLGERLKSQRSWKNAEEALRSKREQKVKYELTAKCEEKRVQMLNAEIKMLEERVEERKTNFEDVSKTVKVEFEYFNTVRFENFKHSVKAYLELMLQTQNKLLERWDAYLIHAKAIN